MRDEDGEAGVGVDRTFLHRADAEIETRQAELRAVGAKHQARHGKMEGADAVEGDGGNNRFAHDTSRSADVKVSQFFRSMSIGSLSADRRWS